MIKNAFDSFYIHISSTVIIQISEYYVNSQTLFISILNQRQE